MINMANNSNMKWETRHTKAVQDYEKKEKEGKTKAIDMTAKLDKLNAIKH